MAIMEDISIPTFLALNITFHVLTLIIVVLRLVSRRLAKLPLWWDDWLMIIAEVRFFWETRENKYSRHFKVVLFGALASQLLRTPK